MRIKIIILLLAALVIWGTGFAVWSTRQPQPTPTPSATPVVQVTDNITYQGQSGRDALTLLKEKASVEQDASGLVVSINGRKADSAKREYWAFYVNGELASIGPADYQTKDEDKIEWKIEKY